MKKRPIVICLVGILAASALVAAVGSSGEAHATGSAATMSNRGRVAALAEPGEVLISSTVKDLVAGSGLEFDDRGRHTLKGVPGEWHLYALRRDQ